MVRVADADALRHDFENVGSDWAALAAKSLSELPRGSGIRMQQVSAENLRSIYSVRYMAHRDGHGPAVQNFAHFLDALAVPGEVEFVSLRRDGYLWIYVLRDGAPTTYLAVKEPTGQLTKGDVDG